MMAARKPNSKTGKNVGAASRAGGGKAQNILEAPRSGEFGAGLKASKFLSAKAPQPKADQGKAPGTYFDFKDPLKFDARFDVDAPKITGIDWKALFPQPTPEKPQRGKGGTQTLELGINEQ